MINTTITTNEGQFVILGTTQSKLGELIQVRRPRGKKEGFVVRFENGNLSTVTWLDF